CSLRIRMLHSGTGGGAEPASARLCRAQTASLTQCHPKVQDSSLAFQGRGLLKADAPRADPARVGTAAPRLTAPRSAPSVALGRLRGFAAREGILIGAVGLFLAFWSLATPDAVVADSWLTLLGGREIAALGIPHTDTLAVITHGQPWVDQQWLAQLAYWGVYRLGGLRLDLLLTIVLELAALVIVLVASRRRGGSDAAVAAFAVVSFFYVW